jgi:hypothetical protein
MTSDGIIDHDDAPDWAYMMETLQENCPLPTAIFQSIDIFTYGHLRTVAKSRFLPFFI